MSSQAENPERHRTSPDDLSECVEPQVTFRDPAGQLQLTRAHALRRINPEAVEETLAFLTSPLRAALERSGDLIPSEIVQPGIAQPRIVQSGPDLGALPAELWLQHPRIDPISYPWEWTTAQWRSAAELTLRIAGQAIDAGWMLKDATPLNILFAGARPILVDVLSLERRNPNSTTWLAYGQFVRTFLLPLVAEKLLNWPLQTTLFFRDGYEPRTIYEALPRWQRLRPSLLDVVTLATMFESKSGKADKARRLPSTSDPELATHILHKRISRLGKQVRSAARSEASSQWSSYQQSASHYQAADTEAKQQFVRGVLERLRPAHVLDIGANTGLYSLMAVETGAQVVALDSDPAAIEALWHTAERQGLAVTALVANIARPTPAVGWRNREQLSLLDRLSGQFDLVLILAVIHHLILREQVPLGHIGDLCSRLTRQWLLVEWVPPSDPMFQEWLRGRDAIYGHLTEADLTQAFAPFFEVSDRTVLGNGRILLLFERKPAARTQKEAATA